MNVRTRISPEGYEVLFDGRWHLISVIDMGDGKGPERCCINGVAVELPS